MDEVVEEAVIFVGARHGGRRKLGERSSAGNGRRSRDERRKTTEARRHGKEDEHFGLTYF